MCILCEPEDHDTQVSMNMDLEIEIASFHPTSDFEDYDDYNSSGSFSSPEEDYGSVNNASEFTV